MDKYSISIWPGVGYYTKQIEVEAFDELGALETALAYCERQNLCGLFLDVKDVDALELTEEEKEEIFLYLDPACKGARPAFFRLENLSIKKVS